MTARDQLNVIGYNSNMVADFSYDNGGRRTGRTLGDTLGDTPGTATTWTYGRSDNLVTSIATPNVTSFAFKMRSGRCPGALPCCDPAGIVGAFIIR